MIGLNLIIRLITDYGGICLFDIISIQNTVMFHKDSCTDVLKQLESTSKRDCRMEGFSTINEGEF